LAAAVLEMAVETDVLAVAGMAYKQEIETSQT
jgi:hypothetical protein